jgi:predicted transcriptional regulator
MSGRKLNGQQRNAMFTMRHRAHADLRALSSSGVSEAEMEDLVDDGYAVHGPMIGTRRSYKLTRKGNQWVDKNLP